ncbi:hypothetical protein D3Y55_27815 [Mesorhizobium sp. DCY119]|nr:hypothetical protein D3Y55_27815 [Mesorhizobium sp. DCY119]
MELAPKALVLVALEAPGSVLQLFERSVEQFLKGRFLALRVALLVRVGVSTLRTIVDLHACRSLVTDGGIHAEPPNRPKKLGPLQICILRPLDAVRHHYRLGNSQRGPVRQREIGGASKSFKAML